MKASEKNRVIWFLEQAVREIDEKPDGLYSIRAFIKDALRLLQNGMPSMKPRNKKSSESVKIEGER